MNISKFLNHFTRRNMNPTNEDAYTRRKEAELKTFSDNFNVHDLPDIFHYWSHKFLKPKFDAIGIRGVNEFYEDWMFTAAKRAESILPRFCSVGSGNCDVEIALAKALRNRGLEGFTIECLELNPVMLERGRAQATDEGLSDFMKFSEVDFNVWVPEIKYDAVIANQSLHHVVELEHLFSAIKSSLKPGGLFISSDMIGRNGHLRWPESLDIVHEFWRELPEGYKYNVILKRTEPLYENWDCSSEGFEGIRAQDVLPLLASTFKFEVFLGFGNAIDIFIDRCFGHHFSKDNEWDTDFIDRVHARDDQAIIDGTITPTHMFAVMSNDHPTVSRYWNDIPPQRMIRHPKA